MGFRYLHLETLLFSSRKTIVTLPVPNEPGQGISGPDKRAEGETEPQHFCKAT